MNVILLLILTLSCFMFNQIDIDKFSKVLVNLQQNADYEKFKHLCTWQALCITKYSPTSSDTWLLKLFDHSQCTKRRCAHCDIKFGKHKWFLINERHDHLPRLFKMSQIGFPIKYVRFFNSSFGCLRTALISKCYDYFWHLLFIIWRCSYDSFKALQVLRNSVIL